MTSSTTEGRVLSEVASLAHLHSFQSEVVWQSSSNLLSRSIRSTLSRSSRRVARSSGRLCITRSNGHLLDPTLTISLAIRRNYEGRSDTQTHAQVPLLSTSEVLSGCSARLVGRGCGVSELAGRVSLITRDARHGSFLLETWTGPDRTYCS